ncbi:MAG: tetratricopeptide repeat protein [Nitrospirota bacterium]
MAIDKNAVIKEAQKFTAKGQFDKAIAEWKKLIKESPNDANIFNTIGDLSLKKNAKADAVDAYKKAADILAADGFSSKAIALYKKVVNIDPKKVDVHLALADLNAEKGLTGNALESYKIAADHYAQKNEMAKALGIYQKMADLNPANFAFRLKLAEMYVKEGLKSEAAKAYLEAADAHMAKEAFQEARQIFEKVLALDPNNKDVYFKAGVVYYKEGKFVEACKAFKPAFEHDPKNQELAELYLDSLFKAGRGAEAEEAIRKLLSQDAGRVDLREKLFHIYLSKKDFEKALTEAVAVADFKVENREFDAADELFKKLVAENPKDAALRRKLADFYGNIRREEDGARELIQAADILAVGGDREGAKEALSRAVEIAPGMEEARRRLEAFDGQPAFAQAEEPPLSIPEAAAPGPAAVDFEAGPAVSAESRSIEEDPAIAEAFTEVDVLIKYGLAGKAIEQLEGIAGRFPQSPQVRLRLRDLYRDQGNSQKAVQHALGLADIYSAAGMQEQAETALRSALDMDPGNAALQARLGMPSAAPQEAPPGFGELPEFGFEAAPEAAASAPGEPTVEWQPPMEETLAFEEPESSVVSGRAGSAPEAASGEWRPSSLEIGGEPFGAASEPAAASAEPFAAEVDISEVWAEAEFYYQQGLFDEARAHYEKILQLSPGDQRARGRIAEISREKEDVQEFSKLAEAVEGLEGLVPTETAEGELASSTSDEEAVRMLMQEIQALQGKQKPAPPAKQPRAASAPAGFAADSGKKPGKASEKKREEEEFFDLGAELGGAGTASPRAPRTEGPDEFFDLAAELRDELGGMAVPAKGGASSEDQSLDDIFQEFKKGVEAQAGREDTDTHYNLGIAYKEMGLLDEAIGEFLLTPEGEPKFIQSRYMLGLCYMEMGDFRKATVEIGNALNYSESLASDAEDRLSMNYDLGLAYQGAGEMSNALGQFQKVSAEAPGFRDVAAKIQELQQGDFISLDQLKEDIEKEISAKFFEEGERIEREEKTRKNEKVRS